MDDDELVPNIAGDDGKGQKKAAKKGGRGLDPLLIAHLSAKLFISAPTTIQRASLPATYSFNPKQALGKPFPSSSPSSTFFRLAHSPIGTLAVILAPTHELAAQIPSVLESLLQLRLRPPDAALDDAFKLYSHHPVGT